MSLSYYDEHKKPEPKLGRALMAVNGILALSMAFAWSALNPWFGEAYKWAMRASVSPNPSLLEYPFLALWLTPLLCMMAGWLALKGDMTKFARAIGAYPLLMMAIILGWYYLTPPEWH